MASIELKQRSGNAENADVDLASLEIRMSRSENLPTLPQSASRVLRLADDPDVSPRKIEQAIELDPAVAAKILRVANSAYYGTTQVATLGRAISFLGLTTVRSVIISIAMQQMVTGRTQCPSFNKVDYWRHSLAVGTIARIIGKLKVPGKAEELYCAGMLHEIGLLAMDKFVPQELHVAITRARESGRPLEETETHVLGFNHSQVGAVLSRRWAMSPTVTDAIQNHGHPTTDGEHAQTTLIVAISNALANAAHFTHNNTNDQTGVDPALAHAVGLPEEQFGIICEVVGQEVTRAQELFQIAA